jgi:phage pi2 protein 07
VNQIVSEVMTGQDFNEDKFEKLLEELQSKSLSELNQKYKQDKSQAYPQMDYVNKYFNLKEFDIFYENILRDRIYSSEEESTFLKKCREEVTGRSYAVILMMFLVNKLSYDKSKSEVFKKNWELLMAPDYMELEQAEGIRAYFLDKDNKPQWRFNSKEKAKFIYEIVQRVENELNLNKIF